MNTQSALQPILIPLLCKVARPEGGRARHELRAAVLGAAHLAQEPRKDMIYWGRAGWPA